MNTPTASTANRMTMFKEFFRSESSGAIVLLLSTLVALFWANSPWSGSYFDLVNTCIGVSWGSLTFKMSLGHWVADGLMVIFFFVVGLEIKRELVVGQLSSVKQAVLPVSAALGGMVAPALVYVFFNFRGGEINGWGVPMATDIAFALGILSLFGKRVPIGLKVFLAALAIADDLGAIMVIAIFYTENISGGALVFAGIFLALLAVANRLGIRQTWVYILLAIGAWAGVLASGIHATVAGVLVAMLVPVRATISPNEFLKRTRKRLAELESADLSRDSMVVDKAQMDALDDMYLAVEDMRPAGISLEHQLHPVQAFLILPLFALFKAGVPLGGDSLGALFSPVGLGVISGLFIGKQIGVTLFSFLAVRIGGGALPSGVSWKQIWGASCLAGVGFTMSIFIGELAFKNPNTLEDAKIAILVASLIAGVAGYIVLGRVLPRVAPADS